MNARIHTAAALVVAALATSGAGAHRAAAGDTDPTRWLSAYETGIAQLHGAPDAALEAFRRRWLGHHAGDLLAPPAPPGALDEDGRSALEEARVLALAIANTLGEHDTAAALAHELIASAPTPAGELFWLFELGDVERNRYYAARAEAELHDPAPSVDDRPYLAALAHARRRAAELEPALPRPATAAGGPPDAPAAGGELDFLRYARVLATSHHAFHLDRVSGDPAAAADLYLEAALLYASSVSDVERAALAQLGEDAELFLSRAAGCLARAGDLDRADEVLQRLLALPGRRGSAGEHLSLIHI